MHTTDPPAIDVVVPVYDEAATLARQVDTLHAHLDAEFPGVSGGGAGESWTWRITIADNASTDGTAELADDLAMRYDRVRVVHLAEKGRGRALKAAWSTSGARVLVYVDEDLSTDLSALAPLVAPLLSGHSDVAIGSRLTRSSRVTRGSKREFVSRSYNFLLRRTMGVSFSDAQCGFKAIRSEAAAHLLPLVEDTGWFFDTELLILAERSGLRIHEVPVDWIDDPDSKVDIVSTAVADVRGMLRIGWSIARGRLPLEAVYAAIGRRPFDPPSPPGFFGQVVRFGVVGGLSTLAYALLYLLFHAVVGAQVANFAALVVTAVANTAANRRFTFGVRGPTGAVRHQFQGLAVFLLAWCVTGGSLLVTERVAPHASATTTLVVLTAANLVATALRFALFRLWVFRRPADRTTASRPSSGTGLEARPAPAPHAPSDGGHDTKATIR